MAPSTAFVRRTLMAVSLLAAACGPAAENDRDPSGSAARALPAPDDGGDIHSHARPDDTRVRHMAIDWSVDFFRSALNGEVVLHLETPVGQELHLDTRNLEIREVRTSDAAGGWRAADWVLEDEDPHLGAPLVVKMRDGVDRVRVRYSTRPEATGLQWLEPEQTAGGDHPFLYSQAQAIHARSFVPCQDSPAVRVTYEARVEVESPLRPVMAALDRSQPGGEPATAGRRIWHFEMPHPIPTYLLAIAVGNIEFGEVGPRSGVWAEPEVLERAVWEFADMERMLESTEALYGPYRWNRYDILVLPPSFPFGGMENPMLTFATPTILAGDRSLVSLVAHELAHSWSGNLVTNATWSDFWLNEGFTTYIERRIMEAVYGEERAEMEWTLGRQDLVDAVDSFADEPRDQILHVNLAGRNPDDGMTDIPYEKGSHLVRLLEETYGRETFDEFLRGWFDANAFTSVTTAHFLEYLQGKLLSAHPGKAAPDVLRWIKQPGLPESTPDFSSDGLRQVERAAAAWLDGGSAGAVSTDGWTTQHWLHFLRALPLDVGANRLAELDAAFKLTASGNAEILDRWLVLAIHQRYEAAYPRLEEFLTGQGRRKFLTPLYTALMDTGQEERAREIYARARPLYHSISRRTLDAIVLDS